MNLESRVTIVWGCFNQILFCSVCNRTTFQLSMHVRNSHTVTPDGLSTSGRSRRSGLSGVTAALRIDIRNMTAEITITAVVRCQSFTACNVAIWKSNPLSKPKIIALPNTWGNSQILPEQWTKTINIKYLHSLCQWKYAHIPVKVFFPFWL